MFRRSTTHAAALLFAAIFAVSCDLTAPEPLGFSGRIVFTARPHQSEVHQVWVLDGSSGAAFQLTYSEGDKEEPEISPDGRRVVFSWRVPIAGKDIYYIDLNGSNTTRVTHGQTDAPPSEPSWSPDGTQIVFSELAGGIDFINVSGSNLRRLSFLGYGPDWSPDGSSIAYASDGIIRHVRTTGGLIRTTALDGISINTPRWSPDGSKLAFSGSRNPTDADIYVVNADGTGLQQLTSFEGDALALGPVWSPDGRELAFSGPGGLWLVNASGSRVRRVFAQEGLASPSWHPDPG